jgi:hypothetical protein
MIPTATVTVKPNATATIEPMGQRGSSPREHLIKVVISITGMEGKYADKAFVGELARRSLGDFPPGEGERDRREYGDVSASSRAGKGGTVASVVVGVEGSVIWRGRPTDTSVETLRAALLGEGYRTDIRERRECGEAGCMTSAMVEWNKPLIVPAGWYSNELCGGHNYRTCRSCKSIYRLTATNNAGQAPSVHCEVCGGVLVEWGSSKVWTAELVKRGPLATS